MKGKRIQIYKSPDDRYRWRVKAGNNEIIGISDQGYKSYYYALTRAKISGGLGTPVEKLEQPPDDGTQVLETDAS